MFLKMQGLQEILDEIEIERRSDIGSQGSVGVSDGLNQSAELYYTSELIGRSICG